MAIMIPTVIDEAAPMSERRVFQILREDPDTAGWTVLHSIGLSSAYSGRYGEVDFVAIIPGRGVMCIEVKGGGVRCTNGKWTTSNSEGTYALQRSPFAQARDSMFKLKKAVEEQFGQRSDELSCPFGWIVIFTDSLAPQVSPDFRRDELIDAQDLRIDPARTVAMAPSLRGDIERNGKPSKITLDRLVRFFRPEFDRVPTRATTLWEAEQKIVSLTEEQYSVLDHVADNKASLIQGGAGTGKTMLALELARRLSASGGSVLIACFNRELGLWLEAQAKNFVPGRVVAGHIHRLLRSRIANSEFRDDLPPDGQFSDGLYETGALAVSASDERFDTVIIDEAQDFRGDSLLDLAEAWISPKAGTPKLCFFGDYSRQALYSAPEVSSEAIQKRAAPARFVLRQNCRNTRKVAAETELLTGSFDIRVAPSQSEGVAVERIFFSKPSDQFAALERLLRKLREEGFQPEDIAILSSRRRQNSCLAGVDTCAGFRILDREERKGQAGITFSTVHAFKGLESSAVVLIDLEPQSDSETDALLYVGMTRARARLLMVLPEASRAEIARRERQHFSLDAGQ